MSRTQQRLLLTSGQALGVLGALRGLDRAGYETFVVADRRRSFATWSRAAAGAILAPDPDRDLEGFARAVARGAEELSVAAVLPGTESALAALAGRESLFPPDIALGWCPEDVVERATDKHAFLAIAASAGLRTPPTTRVRLDSLGAQLVRHAFPLVVKPLRSKERASNGTLQAAAPSLAWSPGEVRDVLAGFVSGEGLLQPYLPGDIYGFCAVAWRGELVCSLHQVGERIWPTDCGMVSYVRTVERDHALDEAVAHFIREVGWSGIFQIQFLMHRGGLYAIDLNPRVYISIGLAVAAGLNLTAIWADLLLGRTPEIGEYRVGVRWRSDQDDGRAIAWDLVRGDRRRAARGLIPHQHTTHAVFSWRDPAPFLLSLEKLAARPFARLASRSS